MIRLILIIVLLVPIICIYTILDAIYVFIVGIFNKEYVLRHSEKVVRFVLKVVILISGVKVHITGKNNLKLLNENEAYFVISNHRGFFDIISGYLLFDGHMGIVAKKSISKVPLIAYWMRRINCVFLDRSDIRDGVRMITNCISNIKKGISMWIFPEGTRCKSDDSNELLEFKAGSFKIAEKSSCFILPVAFKNTEYAYEKQMPKIKPVDIYINIGRPYKISELNDNEKINIGKYNQEIIRKLLTEV